MIARPCSSGQHAGNQSVSVWDREQINVRTVTCVRVRGSASYIQEQDAGQLKVTQLGSYISAYSAVH